MEGRHALMTSPRFILLTACKNEGRYIGACLESVIRQTLKPTAWMIVDDGSSDDTAEIVERAKATHGFIHLLRLEPRKGRSFGAQYRAIEKGRALLSDVPYNYLGVLDADIELESPQYFERLFEDLGRNPRLGIAGGVICERGPDQAFQERTFNAAWSVAGAVQMFRRECYEQVGGYLPLEYGGSDTLAELTARMHGWETRSVPGLRVRHHRPTSTADGRYRGLFRLGMLDGSFGSHLGFMFLKCLRRLPYPPWILGGATVFAGYLYYRLSQKRPLIPGEAVRYLREEQVRRVKAALRGAGIAEGIQPPLKRELDSVR